MNSKGEWELHWWMRQPVADSCVTGITPLLAADFFGHTGACKLMLETANANVKEIKPDNFSELLHWCIFHPVLSISHFQNQFTFQSFAQRAG